MRSRSTESVDPAAAFKARSRIVAFPCGEMWFHGTNVILDSQVPLTDFKVREFGRPRLILEGSAYYVSEKSESSCAPKWYRYVLTPWPSEHSTLTRTLFLDDDYFLAVMADRTRSAVDQIVFRALAIFYPFLGFLWSSQKRWLNRIGFESHAISSFSIFTGFLIGFCCGVFLVILEFGAKTMSWTLAAGFVGLMVDSAARYHRLLENQDQIPPGLFEWAFPRRPKDE